MAHALIFGASGISGWAVLDQATKYPSDKAFARITGTTNRPFSVEKAQIAADNRILIASGVDLTRSVPEVVATLKEKIPDVDTVSHVFFTAYIEKDGFDELRKVNTRLLEVAVCAIEQVSEKLQVVILQTGGKGYGLQFPKDVAIKTPLMEDNPRLPEPLASTIFYYPQYDLLERLSQGKSWTFTEIRPDGIVGFTAVSNPMNMAQGIAIYLALYREVKGKGSEVPFPGSEVGYHSSHSDTFQDILAKMEIHAALNPDQCGNGRAFNVADGATVSWAQVWPKLCAYWGLVGKGPDEGATPMLDFVSHNRDAWVTLAKRHDLDEQVLDRQGWNHLHMMLVTFDFDRQYDLSRARAAGFLEEIDTVDGYIISWERMRSAKQLPPQ